MAKPRGKLFVDKAVQGALVKRLILHWIAFFGITLCLLAALDFLLGDPNRSITQCLADTWEKHAVIVLVLVALVPAFVYDTLRLSHRFAGPIFRLRSSLKQLALGEDVAPMRFRETDFWAELADDFNQVADMVRREDAGNYESVEVAESEAVYVPSITTNAATASPVGTES